MRRSMRLGSEWGEVEEWWFKLKTEGEKTGG